MDTLVDTLVEPAIAILAHPVLATTLAALGSVVTAYGVRLGMAACAPGLRGLLRTMFLARGLRLAILGACMIAVVLGALADSPSTIGVALVIAGEETLEIGAVVAALRWGERKGM